MFGRKKKEKVDTVALPKLNDRVYEGSIESAFKAGRAQRKIKRSEELRVWKDSKYRS
jgi:hypothetical protein